MQPINFNTIDYSRLGQRGDQYTANIGQGIKQLGTDISNGWQQYLANQHQKEVWDNQLEQQEFQKQQQEFQKQQTLRANDIQDAELAYQQKIREQQEVKEKQKRDAMRRTKAAIKGMYSSPNGNVSTNGNPKSTASLNDSDGDYILPQGAVQHLDGSVDYNGNHYLKELIEAGSYPDLFKKKNPSIEELRIEELRNDPDFWKKTPQERLAAFKAAGMKIGMDRSEEAQTQEPPDVENFDDVLKSVSKYGMPAQIALLSYLNNEDPDQDASLLGAFSNAITLHDQNEALNAGRRDEEARNASDKAIQASYSDNQVLRDIRRGNIGKTSKEVAAQMDAIDGLRGQVMQINDPLLRTQLLQDIDQQWGKLKPVVKGKKYSEGLASAKAEAIKQGLNNFDYGGHGYTILPNGQVRKDY